MKKSSDTIMSSKLFLVFSVFLIAAQAVNGRTASTEEPPLINGRRVFNGQNAAIGEFPHQVSLQVFNAEMKYFQHFCGGTIINSLWILTAAHCIHPTPRQTIYVKAGKTDLKFRESTEQSVTVVAIFEHELYGNAELVNDIALLKISSPLKLNKAVSKISLPKIGTKPTGNSIVSGWGSVRGDARRGSDILQKAVLPIIDWATCKTTMKRFVTGSLHSTNLCAGGANTDLASACKGDSGGPLIHKKASGIVELIGVVSWGTHRCDSNAPSVFVDVAQFIDWIQGTMKKN